MDQFRYLLHDSLLIVIAQRAAELVIVHGRTVLLHAPQPGNLRRKRSNIFDLDDVEGVNNNLQRCSKCREESLMSIYQYLVDRQKLTK